MTAEEMTAFLMEHAPMAKWCCEPTDDGVIIACDIPGREGRHGKKVIGEPDEQCLFEMTRLWNYQAGEVLG